MSLENCSRCKQPLKKVKYTRIKPMQCSDCGSIRIKSNWKDIQEECKAGSNKPTPLQDKNLTDIRNQKGIAVVINEKNIDSVQTIFDDYYSEVKQ